MWGKCQNSEPSHAMTAFHLGDHDHMVLNQPASASLSGNQVLYGVKKMSMSNEEMTPHWIVGRMELTHSI